LACDDETEPDTNLDVVDGDLLDQAAAQLPAGSARPGGVWGDERIIVFIEYLDTTAEPGP
jgi:hypothetical protein